MHECRFLCLAVSRRDGGNCIAGIDLDSGKWIRPVPTKNRGALGDAEIVVKDHKTQKLRIMAPLDVIHLHLDEPVGNNGQPENWTLIRESGREPYPVLCQANDDSPLVTRVKELAYANGPFSLIFGTPDRKIPHSAIANEPIPHSLCVIRPKNLIWISHGFPLIQGQNVTGVAIYPIDARYLSTTDTGQFLEYTATSDMLIVGPDQTISTAGPGVNRSNSRRTAA